MSTENKATWSFFEISRHCGDARFSIILVYGPRVRCGLHAPKRQTRERTRCLYRIYSRESAAAGWRGRGSARSRERTRCLYRAVQKARWQVESAEQKAEVGHGKALAFKLLSFVQSLLLLLAYTPNVYSHAQP
jgi:hypothetical protein